MKNVAKKGLMLCALMGLTLVGCKSKEEPDDPDRRQQEQVSQLDHLVVSEVFYPGNYQEAKSGKLVIPSVYKEDAYIRITNPTKETQYLDGLTLAMTKFSSDNQLILAKDCDFRETHVGVSQMLQFPGSGQEYAIEPGKSVLVARLAIDHTADRQDGQKGCPNSFDLTKADFQWMTKEQIADWDLPMNKAVPTLKVVYADGDFFEQDAQPLDISKGTGVLMLVKLGADAQKLSDKEYEWECSWNDAAGGHAHGNSDTFLKIPNAWVIDAVNLCPKNSLKWYVVSRKLDGGCANTTDAISKERPRGKSLVRRHDGKNYVDTNNSTVDFEEVESTVRSK